MAKEWTDDEVSEEIRNAVRIVREDKFETFVRGRISPTTDDNGDNTPPPSGGNNADPNGNPPKKKKSLWWGEQE